jgi:hypothetical protein
MKSIVDIAEFRSAQFVPVLPEDCQVNPGRYGAELAFWLCTRLYQQSEVATSYPEFEDWGWLLTYVTEAGEEFALHCGNIDDARDRWLISLRRFGRNMFGGNKPDFSKALPMINAVRKALETDTSVSDLKWHYDGGPTAG